MTKEEENEYLKLLKEAHEREISLYERIIKYQEARIEKLETRINTLETLIYQRDKAIQIYNNNQYNYQTQESDMSNINQSHSGSGDNVGDDKNVNEV